MQMVTLSNENIVTRDIMISVVLSKVFDSDLRPENHKLDLPAGVLEHLPKVKEYFQQ
jgi:hypothetical protein